jgi:hypothetical protein
MRALGEIISPVEPATFFSGYYGRNPLHIEATASDRFDKLLSLDDIDRLLSTIRFRTSDLFVKQAGRTIDVSSATVRGDPDCDWIRLECGVASAGRNSSAADVLNALVVSVAHGAQFQRSGDLSFGLAAGLAVCCSRAAATLRQASTRSVTMRSSMLRPPSYSPRFRS